MARRAAREGIGGNLKRLGLWEVNSPYFPRVKPRPPPRMAKTQPLYTEPHIDYSLRGVGPYGPEAVSQILVSDNLSRASRSNEWPYVDPEYPETCPPMEGLHRLILEFEIGVEGKLHSPQT